MSQEITKKEISGVTYRKNGEGHWVPESLIGQSTLEADSITCEVIDRAVEIQKTLKKFKAWAFAQADLHMEKLSKENNVRRKNRVGKSGGFALYSFCGRYKIRISTTQKIQFDHRLQTAAECMSQYVNRRARGLDAGIKKIVDSAFSPNRSGQVSIEKILSLRAIQINDDDWKSAISLINESMTITSSKRYMNLYQINRDGGWDHVSLDLAAL